MEPSNNMEVEIEENEGYTTDDIEEILEWIDEDVELENEEEEEEYEEESTDFSDDECYSLCVECGDSGVVTVNNTTLCEVCYDGIYRDYD